ncbi:MAG: hypothetical protein ABSB80_13020 [Methanoregula sp.]|jgi:hypothetical protein|uniref:hypothetical protein n=1 Tax=Methanoregula sp. TaxID=2052170 RepID=UPI003D0C1D07
MKNQVIGMTASIEPEKSTIGKITASGEIIDASREILQAVSRIIQISPVPQFLIDQDHHVICWNGALEKVTGIKAEDIVGTSEQWKAFYPVQRPCLADLLVDENYRELGAWYPDKYSPSNREEDAYEATDFFPQINGGKWLHFAATAIKNRDGAVIGTVETVEEVTGRNHAEPPFEEVGAVLHSFDGNTDIIWGIAEIVENIITDISDSPTTADTWKKQEIKKFARTVPFTDTFSEDNLLWIERVKESHHIDKPVTFEYVKRSLEGERCLSSTVCYLGTSTRGHQRFAYMVHDTTGQKWAEHALKLSNRKLHLMNIIAWHEIQNKVTGIRGFVELSKDLAADEDTRFYIEKEEEILKQIHGLIQCSIEYQQIGMKPHHWENVRNTISTVIAIMEVDSLQMDLDVGSLELFCDPILGRMFSLLIENTIKNLHTSPKIHIWYKETTEGLTLFYQDNSAGIPLTQKESLSAGTIIKAEDFFMAFVHDILEFSGMGIKETGEQGGGVCFEISVPGDRYRFGDNSRHED